MKYGDKLVTKEVLNVTPHPGYERSATLLHVAVKSGRKVNIGTKTEMLAMFKDLFSVRLSTEQRLYSF